MHGPSRGGHRAVSDPMGELDRGLRVEQAEPASVQDIAIHARVELAEAVGQPSSTVSDRLHRLAAAGRVRLARGCRGTVVELAPIGNLN